MCCRRQYQLVCEPGSYRVVGPFEPTSNQQPELFTLADGQSWDLLREDKMADSQSFGDVKRRIGFCSPSEESPSVLPASSDRLDDLPQQSASPRYLWESIPPRLAPSSETESDFLQLCEDSDDDSPDVVESASLSWKREVSVCIRNTDVSTGSSASSVTQTATTRIQPLLYSGGTCIVRSHQQRTSSQQTEDALSQIQIELDPRELPGALLSLQIASTGPALPSITVNVAQPQSQDCASSTDRSGRAEPERATQLKRLLEPLKKSGWYYGSMSWQQASSCLQRTAPGTFLARDSKDSRSVFALSVQTCHGPTSIRIRLMDGQVSLDAPDSLSGSMPSFEDLNRLVEYYSHRSHILLSLPGCPLTSIRLGLPLLRRPYTLAHLARMAVHRAGCTDSGTMQALPLALTRFVEDYPYGR